MFYTAKTLRLITYLQRVIQPYKREPQTANLTARSWSRDFLAFRGKCRKNLDLKVSTRFSKIDLKKSIENYCISQNHGWDTRHYCPFALPKRGTEGAAKRRSVEASQHEAGPVIFIQPGQQANHWGSREKSRESSLRKETRVRLRSPLMESLLAQ